MKTIKNIFFIFCLLIATKSFSYTLTRFDQTWCSTSFPTAYVAGSFSIIETSATEFTKNQNNRTIFFDLPAGFEYNTTAGTYSITGLSTNDITAISISAITTSRITVTLSTRSGTQIDLNTITVSCQIRASATASSGNIIRNRGSFKINRSTLYPTSAQSLGILSAQTAMIFSSCTVAQPNTANAPQGTSDNDIIQMQVVMSGVCNSVNITQFNFNTDGGNATGSTNPLNDITKATLYYTGTINSFSPTNTFGIQSSPNGTFSIIGSQALTTGTNYFWLVYEVKGLATVNNKLDAQCNSITFDGGIGAKVPTVQNPTGSRNISTMTQYYSRATGNWNDNTNWSNTDGGASCGCQPNGLGNVFINTNHTITIDANRTVDFVTIRNGATLQDNGTNTLTVSINSQTLGTGKFTATTIWTLNGILQLNGTGASTTTKTFTVAGNTIIGSGTSLTENGIGGNDIVLKSGLTLDGTLSSGTSGGTIIMNGSSAQTISSSTGGAINGSGHLP